MRHTLDKDEEMSEMEARDSVTEQEIEEVPQRRVRWTVTGYGAPLGTRRETWDTVSDIISRAEGYGLRVEVAEVEEEM